MPASRRLRWQPDSNSPASGKPGAVHCIRGAADCLGAGSTNGRQVTRLSEWLPQEAVTQPSTERGPYVGEEYLLSPAGTVADPLPG